MSSNDASTYLRSPRVFFSRMPDGQCAILDTERSAYFGLNGVAARLWALLDTPQTLDGLVEKLLIEFDVSPVQCQADVERFLSQMMEKALVERISQ